MFQVGESESAVLLRTVPVHTRERELTAHTAMVEIVEVADASTSLSSASDALSSRPSGVQGHQGQQGQIAPGDEKESAEDDGDHGA